MMILNLILLGVGVLIFVVLNKEASQGFFGVMHIHQMVALLGVVLPLIGLVINLFFWISRSEVIYLVGGTISGLVLLYGLSLVLINVFEPKQRLKFLRFKKMLKKNGWNTNDVRFARLSNTAGNLFFFRTFFQPRTSETTSVVDAFSRF